jgi:hypothetical protein
VSTLRMWQGAGECLPRCSSARVALSDVSDGWHRVAGYAEVSRHLVPCNVVCDQPEEWRQRTGLATSPRAGQLSDRLVVAPQEDGKGIGRIRMRVIQHPAAASLHPFIQDCIEPGGTVHTDGWQG